MEGKIDIPVSEGMKMVSEILTNAWISELTGIHFVVLSRCMNHGLNNGKECFFSKEQIEKINDAVSKASSLISKIELTSENCFDTIKLWSKRVKNKYLVEYKMGKTVKWKTMHLSDKGNTRYYGVFTEQEVIEFNIAYREIAAKLGSIHLVPDVTESAQD